MFLNPGKLFGNNKIEDFYTDYYVAKNRNKLLCESFYLLGEIEKFGTGFLRIRQTLENYPEISFNIEQVNDFFMATLSIQENSDAEKGTDKGTDKGTENGTDKGTEKLSSNQKFIVNEILKNPYITPVELAKIIGIRADKIRVNISKLKSLNILKRIGPAKGGHWEITN